MQRNYFFDETIPASERISKIYHVQSCMAINFNELFHKDFDSFMDLFIVYGGKKSLYLSGPSKSGKTTMVRQAGEILGLPIREYEYDSDSAKTVVANILEASKNDEVFVLNNADKIDEGIMDSINGSIKKIRENGSKVNIVLVGDKKDLSKSDEDIATISIEYDSRIERRKMMYPHQKRLRDVVRGRN